MPRQIDARQPPDTSNPVVPRLRARARTALASPGAVYVGALSLLFVVSRIALLAIGFRFDTGPANQAVQDVAPVLLRTHLLQSLWYLHGQPPLWNALLGVSYKLFPTHWPQAWHVGLLAAGYALTLGFFALLVALGVPRPAAVTVTAVAILSPVAMLNETVVFYDFPTVVAVTLTVLAAYRLVERPTYLRGLLTFGGAAFLVLTRTLFQLPWLLALLAILLLVCRGHRRIVLLASLTPIALVLGVYVKNIALFGVPSTTSWTGMGLARVAVVALPLAERRRLVAEGKLHVVSLVLPLHPLNQYEAVGIRPSPPRGIPLLDEPSLPDAPRNLEDLTYIRISRLYWQDDLWIIRHRTSAYLRAVSHAVGIYFTSPQSNEGNEALISGYERWYNRLTGWWVRSGREVLVLFALHLAAALGGIVVMVRRLRSGAGARAATIAIATTTILYVGIVGNLSEVGENFRFRMTVDPLALALVVAGVAAAWRGLRSARRAATPVSRPS